MTTIDTDTTTNTNLSGALKSLRTRGGIAIALLAISAGYWAIEAYASFSAGSLSDEFVDIVIGLESLYLLVRIATFVAFVTWAYRAHANLSLMGRNGLNHENQATVWWWFVPVANLWMPFRVMFETVRGSRAETGDAQWRSHTLGTTTIWWTITFIAGLIAIQAATALFDGAVTYGDLETAFTVNGLASLIMLAAAVTAINMINQVRTGQERLATEPRTATTSAYPDVRDLAGMY